MFLVVPLWESLCVSHSSTMGGSPCCTGTKAQLCRAFMSNRQTYFSSTASRWLLSGRLADRVPAVQSSSKEICANLIMMMNAGPLMSLYRKDLYTNGWNGCKVASWSCQGPQEVSLIGWRTDGTHPNMHMCNADTMKSFPMCLIIL